MSRATRGGFTIVELLIVIVVIGILAAITLVAFNGVQQRAQNSKTVSAMSGWVRALKMHKADKGTWPVGWVCLGQGYTFGVSGNDSTGTAQCRQSGATGYMESATFNTTMRPYIGDSLPTPAFVTARTSDTEWRRGLHYVGSGGGDGTVVYIDAAFAGTGDCPDVDGLQINLRVVAGSNIRCNYILGSTLN